MESGDSTMLLVGDVHGKFKRFKNIIDANLHIPIIQVGDMGLGFGENPLSTNFRHAKFIRGNHDNPEVCLKHKGYLGEFGYNEELDFFYVSGAASVWWDRINRTPGYDWWYNEQLTINQFNEAIQLYDKIKPRVMVTHDVPVSLIRPLQLINKDKDGKDGEIFMDNTNTSLQQMLEIHAPEYWFFGHYHKSVNKKIGKTTFVCLAELEEFVL